MKVKHDRIRKIIGLTRAEFWFKQKNGKKLVLAYENALRRDGLIVVRVV